MEHKNIAIWVLSFSLLGAVSEVPGFFLSQVLGGMFFGGITAFVICCVISSRRNRKKEPNA